MSKVLLIFVLATAALAQKPTLTTIEQQAQETAAAQAQAERTAAAVAAQANAQILAGQLAAQAQAERVAAARELADRVLAAQAQAERVAAARELADRVRGVEERLTLADKARADAITEANADARETRAEEIALAREVAAGIAVVVLIAVGKGIWSLMRDGQRHRREARRADEVNYKLDEGLGIWRETHRLVNSSYTELLQAHVEALREVARLRKAAGIVSPTSGLAELEARLASRKAKG